MSQTWKRHDDVETLLEELRIWHDSDWTDSFPSLSTSLDFSAGSVGGFGISSDSKHFAGFPRSYSFFPFVDISLLLQAVVS